MTRSDHPLVPPRRRANSGVQGEVLHYGFATTSVGTILVATGNKGVAAILIREHADRDVLLDALRARHPQASLQLNPLHTNQSLARVAEFIEHPVSNLELPLDTRGTEFQRRVWKAVLSIPFATTTTFAHIASAIGSPRAVRAVGNACSQNPLEFAIPCHRVLRSDGTYSGGSAWGDVRQFTMVTREKSRAARDRPDRH